MFFILLLVLFEMSNCSECYSVVIVGAGASGIASASRLLDNNISNIVILEAEDRIGGRVYSVPVDGAYVDLGAESVHGEKGNLIYEMVKDMNLLEHTDKNIEWFLSNGERVEENLRQEITDFIDEFEEQAEADQPTNIGSEFKKRYKRILMKYRNDTEKLRISRMAMQLAECYINCYEGSYSWFDLAIPNNYESFKGDLYQYWKGTGYKKILDVLMQNHQKILQNKIKLNHKVTSIDYMDNNLIKIYCTNGRTYKAHHVIITVSLGVLKSGNLDFQPKLTAKKLTAIEKMGYGGANKIILYFDEPWWDKNIVNYKFLFNLEDARNVTQEFPFGPKKDNLSWLYYMESIASNKFIPNVLIVWFAGDLVPEMEKTDQSIIVDGIMYLMQKYLGGRYNLTSPTRVIRFPWITNPNFLGTYSYESPEIFKSNEKFQDILASPILNQDEIPLILFAGEATHLKHYSTVHGAIETGFREADRIIKLYCNNNNNNF